MGVSMAVVGILSKRYSLSSIDNSPDIDLLLTRRCQDGAWSMRSWESARPSEKLERGSDSQDRMDHHGA
jgi:hypothetical protein